MENSHQWHSARFENIKPFKTDKFPSFLNCQEQTNPYAGLTRLRHSISVVLLHKGNRNIVKYVVTLLVLPLSAIVAGSISSVLEVIVISENEGMWSDASDPSAQLERHRT